jgi:two-component system, OmpR family, sensor kinase
MIFKSIRWRLQIWYGLLLLAVLAGFGLTAYELQRSKQFHRTDDELRRRVTELGNALRANGPPRDRGLPPRGPRRDRPPPDGETDGPPPFGPRGDGPPDGPRRPPPEFHLLPRQSGLFDETDANGFYYVVWSRNGTIIGHSTNAPADIPMPDKPASSGSMHPRLRGAFREYYIITPPGEVLLAGRSIGSELDDLNRAALLLAGVGGLILVFGLAGGWWLAGRAIHPINDISAAAVKIAAGDLSQRINLADTENELGRLGTVLNSTFDRLGAALEEQKQFTADAAHELRTPVSVVLTQTQTALTRDRTAAEYRETVESCQRAAQRMRRLIESLLELARLDAGQEPMKRQRVNLVATTLDCTKLVQPLADQRKVHIYYEVPPLECVGDSERIGQVITNLLTNAVNYNKENGEVRIAGVSKNGTAIITVTDTGPGIPPEDLPHIFKRFYRAEKSRTAGRTGLGLSISKAIIDAHGGALDVISESGKGTTFTIRLPKVD